MEWCQNGVSGRFFIHGMAEGILEWCDTYDDDKTTATPNKNSDYVGSGRWGTSRAPATLKQWANNLSQYAREVNRSILDVTADELIKISQGMKDGKAHAISERAKNNGGLSAIAASRSPRKSGCRTGAQLLRPIFAACSKNTRQIRKVCTPTISHNSYSALLHSITHAH